jgi:hypothetical protein
MASTRGVYFLGEKPVWVKVNHSRAITSIIVELTSAAGIELVAVDDAQETLYASADKLSVHKAVFDKPVSIYNLWLQAPDGVRALVTIQYQEINVVVKALSVFIEPRIWIIKSSDGYDAFGEPLRDQIEPAMAAATKGRVHIEVRPSLEGVDPIYWTGDASANYDAFGEPLREFLEPILAKAASTVYIEVSANKDELDFPRKEDYGKFSGTNRPGGALVGQIEHVGQEHGSAAVKLKRLRHPETDELLSERLQIELRLGNTSLRLTAIGLEDPDNASSLREALRTKDPDRLEACLPLVVFGGSHMVRVAPTGAVSMYRDEWPDSAYEIEVSRLVWDEALDSLAKEWEDVSANDGPKVTAAKIEIKQ